MKNLRSHFRFNKQERSGIFFLLLTIVSLQVAFFILRSQSTDTTTDSLSVNEEMQAQINALKDNVFRRDTLRIYPFNPNFITDYKGYTLGMSVEEIDRLHAFRSEKKFANSKEEFQKVTGVSDSLLRAISPYFKFPDWTQTSSKRSTAVRKQYSVKENSVSAEQRSFPAEGSEKVSSDEEIYQDLNTSTAQDLKRINGIGEKLSARIIKFRDRLGGFLVDEQLYDVYGLEPEVVQRTLEQFKVLKIPNIQKMNINKANVEELSKLIYIQKEVAERIVNYRNANGSIVSFEELKNIEGFPTEKIERIALYLSL